MPWSDAFKDLPDGFQAAPSDRALVDAAGGRGAAIYGELIEATFDRILQWWRPGPEDILLDLGSGTGRFAAQAAMTTEVGEVVAIELSRFRHGTAVEGIERLRALGPDGAAAADRIRLVEDDFLTASLPDATLVYCGSTCFPAELWACLCRRVDRELPHLRSLIAPRPLPEDFQGRLREVGRFPGSATWMDEIDVYALGR